MKVVLIEDEPLAIAKLERLIHACAPTYEIVAKLASIKEAVTWLSKASVDLIFLDIHLADGNSFNIFEHLEINTPIIFTTAYDEYAIKAFKVNSIDYLLKPVSRRDLEAAIAKFERFGKEEQLVPAEALKQLLQQQTVNYKKRFVVPVGNKLKKIDASEVAFFQAEGKHVFLTVKSGEQYLFTSTLEKLMETLDPARFFRVNRQFTIQIDAIREMYNHTKGRVRIELKPKPEKEVVVSVERASAFKQWLNE